MEIDLLQSYETMLNTESIYQHYLLGKFQYSLNQTHLKIFQQCVMDVSQLNSELIIPSNKLLLIQEFIMTSEKNRKQKILRHVNTCILTDLTAR